VEAQDAVDDRPPQARVLDREQHFDAAAQVARHQVGAAG
jgi:hypothetical protein